MAARVVVGPGDTLDRAVQHMVSRALEQIHPQLHAWVGTERVRHALSKHVAEYLAACGDAEAAARRHQACPVPGLTDDDYAPRLLVDEQGRHAILEQRFKGLRPDEPFVEVVADEAPATPARLLDLSDMAREHFARARPRALRLFVGSHREQPWGDNDWEADLHELVAPVDALRSQPPPTRHDSLQVQPCRPERCYPRYVAAYESFAARAPHLSGEVERVEAAEIARHVEVGVALEAFVGDRWAGYVAATPAPYLGASGYVVCEEIVDPAFLGQGYGPALQRYLIDRLPIGALLWGTIHHLNGPSLGTARRVGRLDVGAHRLVSLAARP